MDIVLDALERINNILDVDEDKLPLLSELTQIQADMLSEKLGGDIPPALTFIVIETTISRYRRVGAEGMSDKKVDVIQHSYSEDLFHPYKEIIDKYSQGDSPKRIVRVI